MLLLLSLFLLSFLLLLLLMRDVVVVVVVSQASWLPLRRRSHDARAKRKDVAVYGGAPATQAPDDGGLAGPAAAHEHPCPLLVLMCSCTDSTTRHSKTTRSKGDGPLPCDGRCPRLAAIHRCTCSPRPAPPRAGSSLAAPRSRVTPSNPHTLTLPHPFPSSPSSLGLLFEPSPSSPCLLFPLPPSPFIVLSLGIERGGSRSGIPWRGCRVCRVCRVVQVQRMAALYSIPLAGESPDCAAGLAYRAVQAAAAAAAAAP